MGHPQLPTPVVINNSNTCGILNETVKRKRTQAIDMSASQENAANYLNAKEALAYYAMWESLNILQGCVESDRTDHKSS
eukprot:15344904-Ditylum_brightwellii.AAC.1